MFIFPWQQLLMKMVLHHTVHDLLFSFSALEGYGSTWSSCFPDVLQKNKSADFRICKDHLVNRFLRYYFCFLWMFRTSFLHCTALCFCLAISSWKQWTLNVKHIFSVNYFNNGKFGYIKNSLILLIGFCAWEKENKCPILLF